MLPPSTPAATTVNDEQDDEDEQRTATLLLLRLAYAQAYAQLASIAQELELLRMAPPAPPHQPGTSERARVSPEAERTLWTLDAPRAVGMSQRGGPLLDQAGKVCDLCSALFWCTYDMNAAIATVHDTTFWRGGRPCEVAGTGFPA